MTPVQLKEKEIADYIAANVGNENSTLYKARLAQLQLDLAALKNQ